MFISELTDRWQASDSVQVMEVKWSTHKSAYKRAGRVEESAEQWKMIAQLRAVCPVDEKFAEAVDEALNEINSGPSV